jgi:hypothetical protein
MLRQITAVGLLTLASGSTAQPLLDYEAVSLINLIATPERFDKKSVVVSGWLRLEHENMSLCLGDHVPSTKECVWIEFEYKNQSREEFRKRLDQWKQHHDRLVMVHGLFDRNNTGHLGGWSGALHSIVRVTPVPRKSP